MSKPSSTGREGNVARVRVTPQAETDLEEIWLTIAVDSPSAADKLLRRIAAKLGRLAEFPDMGSSRPEIAPSARILVEGNYLILYEPVGDDVEVVRVVHGARDLRDLF
jgi:toxin ParE1/3/4